MWKPMISTKLYKDIPGKASLNRAQNIDDFVSIGNKHIFHIEMDIYIMVSLKLKQVRWNVKLQSVFLFLLFFHFLFILPR